MPFISGQLHPVQGNCLWDKRAKLGSDNFKGFMLYNMFTTVMKLTKNMRLDDSDPDSESFDGFLIRLSDGSNTDEDWKVAKD